MNQQQIDKIRETVNTHGLSKTISLFGDNKDIIRQAYIDNPESYLDYLIDNIVPMDGSDFINKAWTYNFKKNIFIVYDDNQDIVTVDDYIWNFFYRGVMQFDNTKIESIFTEWFYKHIPELSEKKPISYSDLDNITRKWKHAGLLGDIDGVSKIKQQPLRSCSDYMVVSKSIAEFFKSINLVGNK